jgi:nucleoside-diphosphate-sugar epimerase
MHDGHNGAGRVSSNFYPGPIFVTGTGGFIARHLALRLLGLGHKVVGFDRKPSGIADPRYREVVADLLDATAVRRAVAAAAPRVVFHLAARTDLDEKHDLNGYAANIDGVRNLVEAIADAPSVERAICTSTQLVCRIGYVPKHDQDYAPSTLYGESKVHTERIWRDADGAGREWCLVRPTTIWGPGMNPHYLRFFQMVRDGRYFHVGRGPTYKSYGYVGNVVHEYVQLMHAPAEAIRRRTFYLADYEPLALEAWADAFALELSAPRIRHLPKAVAVSAAKVGDLLERVGWTRFPFTSFRLRNVLTAYRVDTEPTEVICGPLPFTWREGVRMTCEWLREVWRGATSHTPAARVSEASPARR